MLFSYTRVLTGTRPESSGDEWKEMKRKEKKRKEKKRKEKKRKEKKRKEKLRRQQNTQTLKHSLHQLRKMRHIGPKCSESPPPKEKEN